MDNYGTSSTAKPARRRMNLTTIVVVVVTVLLLAVNLVLGFVLVEQSAAMMKSLINQRMLDVSNTAASMIDGDSFEALTAEDEGTEAYQEVYDTLYAFQSNIDLEYIYGIKQIDEDTFIFTIDPDPDDPGKFGEPIVTTDALKTAATGTAAVDEVPYEDAWGRFYSAYSPVFDSKGNVAGLVGVDYAASWYDEQIATHKRTATTVGALSLIVGGLVVVVITSRLRSKFHLLYDELSYLSEDVESLTKEIARPSTSSDANDTQLEQAGNTTKSRPFSTRSVDIDELADKIRSLQSELRVHIQRVREQAYTDSLTGVGSKTTYVEAIEQIGGQINEGTASFSVAVFDINGLKEANDTYGHEEGDKLIIRTAQAICKTFGKDHVYRVGGDEFIVVLDGTEEQNMPTLFARFDDVVTETNLQSDPTDVTIAVSKGFANFDPQTDEDYQAVFRRADHEMYADKAEYYKTHGDRRRR